MIELVAATASALAVSLGVSWLAMTAGVLDMPNARSSHSRPTPRAGGLGLLAGASAGILAASLLGWPADGLAAILLAGAAAGVLGLADDLVAPPALLKMAAIAAISVALAAWSGPVTALPATQDAVLTLPYAAGLAGSALYLFVVINAANFMDGADEMLVRGLLPASAGAVLLGLIWGVAEAALTGAVLAGALIGFLMWNRHPARVFAGDVGSLSAGALIGAATLSLAVKGPPGAAYLAPLLLLPFIADVLLTLLKRAQGGRLSLEAHREHAYQVLLKAGWPHSQVSQLWFTLAAACLAAAAVPALAAAPAWVMLAALVAASIAAAALYARAHGRS